MTWIQTYSGSAFDLHDTRATVVPEDLALALANLCRFNGHTRRFYSVAEHSINVARIVEREHPEHPGRHLAALLHDAHEAYVGDLVAPIKAAMPLRVAQWWHDLTTAADAAIARAFELPGASVFLWSEIKRADLIMLATEKRDLMGPEPRPWIDLPEPEPEPLGDGLDPAAACAAFFGHLARYVAAYRYSGFKC